MSPRPAAHPLPRIDDELDLLAQRVGLRGVRLIELGCGPARLARDLLARFPDARLSALEVDTRQHAKNLQAGHPRLDFLLAGAQAIPFPDGVFDGALMLKSLHHVPEHAMDQALREAARVLKPGGWLYVSEPVYAGPLNGIMRLFNDEGRVRAAAQQALDRAVAQGMWQSEEQIRFETPVHFEDFERFEQRMMRPSYADHRIDDELRQAVREKFEPHMTADGVHLTRPMHVRLLHRRS